MWNSQIKMWQEIQILIIPGKDDALWKYDMIASILKQLSKI